MYDVAITDGILIDGTGKPRFRGDIAIKGGRIVRIGRIDPGSAEKRFDARGLIVSPGFIDLHSHSDLVFALDPERQTELLSARVRQGITTEIVGNCGLGVVPADKRSKPILKAMFEFLTPKDLQWEGFSIGDYLDHLEDQGVALNIGTLVPHGAVRATAMGGTGDAPSEAEFGTMERLIAQSLEEGAFGTSFGLIYPPGSHASTDELIRLCRAMRGSGGYAAFHQRGGGPETLAASVAEIIQVGREAHVSVHHSHEQIHGKGDWSAIWRTVEMKDQARREGVDITQDMIPYTSVCTTMTAIYPPWALVGGPPKLTERLKNPSTRRRIERDIEEVVPNWPPWGEGGWPVNIVRDFGWENLYVAFVPKEENKWREMKSLTQIAEMEGKTPFDALSDLVINEKGTVTQLIFGISGNRTTDEPLKALMSQPGRMFITDAWEIGRGTPHPGAYGAYPRILGRYVRDEKVLSLEEAIRRMTALPAGRLGLGNRGTLEEGAWADIVVFDPERVTDTSTYEAPRCYPEGISYVIINGSVVLEGGKYSRKMAGQVLRRGLGL